MVDTLSNELLQRTRAFLDGIEAGKCGDELDEFYHPDVEQTEYPNALTKQVSVRTLPALKAASLMVKQILTSQKYEVVKEHVTDDNTVMLEAIWTATIAIPIGSLAPGSTMKAYFLQIFEYKDGRIYRQRNYDCFEPF